MAGKDSEKTQQARGEAKITEKKEAVKLEAKVAAKTEAKKEPVTKKDDDDDDFHLKPLTQEEIRERFHAAPVARGDDDDRFYLCGCRLCMCGGAVDYPGDLCRICTSYH